MSYTSLLNAESGIIADKASHGSRTHWIKNLFHGSSWALALAIFALVIAITKINMTSDSQCIAQSTVWCK